MDTAAPWPPRDADALGSGFSSSRSEEWLDERPETPETPEERLPTKLFVAPADAGERLRDVSLEDGPSDAHRAAQVDALRRAVVEVTRVLQSGAASGAVDASLRGVVATLETAADAMGRDAKTPARRAARTGSRDA